MVDITDNLAEPETIQKRAIKTMKALEHVLYKESLESYWEFSIFGKDNYMRKDYKFMNGMEKVQRETFYPFLFILGSCNEISWQHIQNSQEEVCHHTAYN